MEYIKFSLSRDLLYFSIFAGIIGFLFYKLGMDWTFTPETIFTCLAVAVIIGIILCIFVPRRRERKNGAAFFHFCRLLKTESYFSSYSWQQRYSRFCRNNPLHSLSSFTLKGDISYRYIVMSIKRDIGTASIISIAVGIYFASVMSEFLGTYLCDELKNEPGDFIRSLFGSDAVVYLDNFFKSRFNVYFIVFITAVITEWFLYITVLYLLSLRIFNKWLKRHPHYLAEQDKIKQSYLHCYAFECSYFCTVVGSEYIHAFDGRNFHTVNINNVSHVKWLIEKYKVYYESRSAKTYAGDEYRFNLKFTCGGTDIADDFHITLDQFQGKMIMEKFFPDISNDINPDIKYSDISSHYLSSIGGCTSSLVLEP